MIETPIVNDHGLLFYDKPGGRELLPHLMDFGENGVHEPAGQVNVDPGLVEEHNRLYDQALIEGLKKCPMGQCGIFYFDPDQGQVRTFTGVVVAAQPTVNGNVVTFRYGNKMFQGRASLRDQTLGFRRVK